MVSVATYDASIFQPALVHGILYSQNELGDNATSFYVSVQYVGIFLTSLILSSPNITEREMLFGRHVESATVYSEVMNWTASFRRTSNALTPAPPP
jgi:hypothetical protein